MQIDRAGGGSAADSHGGRRRERRPTAAAEAEAQIYRAFKWHLEISLRGPMESK